MGQASYEFPIKTARGPLTIDAQFVLSDFMKDAEVIAALTMADPDDQATLVWTNAVLITTVRQAREWFGFTG